MRAMGPEMIAVEVLRATDVLSELRDGYHPQNPSRMHPADFVTSRFELDRHEGLRDV
jgi:hypothetical protein